METNLVLLLTAGALVAAGVYLMMDKVFTRILMGILLAGNGVNLLILQAGGRAGSPPILYRESAQYGETISDPLAQAMILTAIVISMAMTAFILALIYRQYRYRTADIVETDTEDQAIAFAARTNAVTDTPITTPPTTRRPAGRATRATPSAWSSSKSR